MNKFIMSGGETWLYSLMQVDQIMIIVPKNKKLRLFGFSRKLNIKEPTKHMSPSERINRQRKEGKNLEEKRVDIMISAAPN